MRLRNSLSCVTRSLLFEPLSWTGEAAERSALHSTAPLVMEAQHLIRTTRPDGEKTRGGEGHTANGLKSVLRRCLERRAQDCARNVRPSRAANNDPHPRAQGALALSLTGRGIMQTLSF